MNIYRSAAFAMLLAFSAGLTAQVRPPRFAAGLVQAHNIERRLVGAAPLVWSTGLAAAADRYALHLARTDRWGHSALHQRVGQGENLWMGSRGAYRLEGMVAAWSSEKRIFRAGVFPDVSRTGSWFQVGHYTQMVWPATTSVGCSMRSSAHWDYLVCRYAGPGNVVGQRVGAPRYARN
jgi:hypothetical protein